MQGIERCDHGRRGHDLVIVCSVAATVGAAIADTFERRWQAATDDDIPPMPLPPRDPLEGLIGGLPMLPLAQNARQVTQVEPHNLPAVPQPEQQESVTVVLPPARPSDGCARHGLRRVDYTQNHHRY